MTTDDTGPDFDYLFVAVNPDLGKAEENRLITAIKSIPGVEMVFTTNESLGVLKEAFESFVKDPPQDDA